MNKITSFTINHLTLLPGLYVSRVDEMDGFKFTTFDLRVTRPNFEPVMDTSVCHTIEHLAATYFRNYYPQDTMYFGPMGCRTGFYLIVKGEKTSEEYKKPVIDCFKLTIFETSGLSVQYKSKLELIKMIKFAIFLFFCFVLRYK